MLPKVAFRRFHPHLRRHVVIVCGWLEEEVHDVDHENVADSRNSENILR